MSVRTEKQSRIVLQAPEGTDIDPRVTTDLMRVPDGKVISQYDFTYNASGNVATIKAYDGAELLFTLTFSYDATNRITSIART
jgi:hypothetical protein